MQQGLEDDTLGMCVACAYMGRYGLPIDVIMLVLGHVQEIEDEVASSPLIWNKKSNLVLWPVLITDDHLRKHHPRADLLSASTNKLNDQATSSETLNIDTRALDGLFNKKEGTWFRFAQRKNGTVRPSLNLNSGANATNFYYHSIHARKNGYILVFFKKATVRADKVSTKFMKSMWLSETSLEPLGKHLPSGRTWLYEEVRHDTLRIDLIDRNKSLKSQEIVSGDIIIYSSVPLTVKDGVMCPVK